jgi:hypothetical protein
MSSYVNLIERKYRQFAFEKNPKFYLNLSCSWSSQCSSGSSLAHLPFSLLGQVAQSTPRAFSKGLLEEQVPLNSPFGFNKRFTERNTKNRANTPRLINSVRILIIYFFTNLVICL